MEITPTTTRSTAAPLPERAAPATGETPSIEAGLPPSTALDGMAWFDLNGDGKIDNLSTFAGGDSYLNGATIDLSHRFAVSAREPSQPRGPASSDYLVARAARAYAAHAAAPQNAPAATASTPVAVAA